MAHSPKHDPSVTPVVLLGDTDTVDRRDDLATAAAEQNCVIVDAFGFTAGAPGGTDELGEVDAVVAALSRAVSDHLDVWVPFLGPDLGREQHWRRISLVLQRHGVNLRYGRKLWEMPVDGGVNEIDLALRREVKRVDALDHAVLAAAGVKNLGREIERMLAASVGRRVAAQPPAVPRASVKGYGPPALPAPHIPWEQRQPLLKRYAGWLVHGCGVTQAATARVLNSTGQRTPTGKHWQPGTVSALLNGQYDQNHAPRS